jgi:hypothetical protein
MRNNGLMKDERRGFSFIEVVIGIQFGFAPPLCQLGGKGEDR